jgi:hypothetical protein
MMMMLDRYYCALDGLTLYAVNTSHLAFAPAPAVTWQPNTGPALSNDELNTKVGLSRDDRSPCVLVWENHRG